MFAASKLHDFVEARFREAFGPPRKAHGKDEYWSMRLSDDAVALGVLLNGTDSKPALWIFDPDDRTDGPFKTYISRPEEVDGLIKGIQERVKRG